MFDQSTLSSEEKIRRAVRAAKLEMAPAHIEFLKKVPPEIKLANAFSLFRMARDALYYQEIRRGTSPEEAMRVAARRMLDSNARALGRVSEEIVTALAAIEIAATAAQSRALRFASGTFGLRRLGISRRRATWRLRWCSFNCRRNKRKEWPL